MLKLYVQSRPRSWTILDSVTLNIIVLLDFYLSLVITSYLGSRGASSGSSRTDLVVWKVCVDQKPEMSGLPESGDWTMTILILLLVRRKSQFYSLKLLNNQNSPFRLHMDGDANLFHLGQYAGFDPEFDSNDDG